MGTNPAAKRYGLAVWYPIPQELWSGHPEMRANYIRIAITFDTREEAEAFVQAEIAKDGGTPVEYATWLILDTWGDT